MQITWGFIFPVQSWPCISSGVPRLCAHLMLPAQPATFPTAAPPWSPFPQATRHLTCRVEYSLMVRFPPQHSRQLALAWASPIGSVLRQKIWLWPIMFEWWRQSSWVQLQIYPGPNMEGSVGMQKGNEIEARKAWIQSLPLPFTVNQGRLLNISEWRVPS